MKLDGLKDLGAIDEFTFVFRIFLAIKFEVLRAPSRERQKPPGRRDQLRGVWHPRQNGWCRLASTVWASATLSTASSNFH